MLAVGTQLLSQRSNLIEIKCGNSARPDIRHPVLNLGLQRSQLVQA